MALIHCPECDKEISDKAQTCPHCGYELHSVLPPAPKKSDLSEKKTNTMMGIAFIITGIVVIIGSLFLVAFIIGIFGIIGGAAIISVGANKISGIQEGTCPYCGSTISVPYKSSTFKCPQCKKVSKKTENCLEAIE